MNKHIRPFSIFLIFTTLLLVIIKTGTFANRQTGESISKEKQAQHSRLYTQQGGKKLTDLANREPVGTETGIYKEHGLEVQSGRGESAGPSLIGYSCTSDAVVVGIIRDESSAFSEDQTTVFTDYRISIEEVLKNNRTEVMSPASSITVTRAGGLVEFNGRKIRVTEEDGASVFGLNERYLLFLQDLPATNSFQLRPGYAFLLSEKGSVYLERKAGTLSAGNHAIQEFLNEARIAANAVCSRKRQPD